MMADAVVAQPIPAFAQVGGVPAGFVKDLTPPPDFGDIVVPK